MSIVSGLVLYAVIWFLVLFILIPVGLETQGDRGEIEPGTHAGAPANFNVRKTVIRASWISALIWVVIAAVLFSGLISVRDLDFFDRMRSPAGGTGG
ncbi:DUF1467 family protein [Ovoidimarina sediminis]|uniref:DUF1467 family protein n=1 Tax=Ovoidimarina sediminis TaxID=3079856 RepID=UPI00291026A5|nr:DUF1467 family protein [Rhodophyticola sp. MJ-SS7]MDU8943011.1 DUF1467 family protein [Rhodophyticola sp. MJ-SS7]